MEYAKHHADELAAKLRTLYPEIDAHGIDLAQLIRNFEGA